MPAGGPQGPPAVFPQVATRGAVHRLRDVDSIMNVVGGAKRRDPHSQVRPVVVVAGDESKLPPKARVQADAQVAKQGKDSSRSPTQRHIPVGLLLKQTRRETFGQNRAQDGSGQHQDENHIEQMLIEQAFAGWVVCIERGERRSECRSHLR